MTLYMFSLKHTNGNTETVSVKDVSIAAATARVQRLYPTSTIICSL